MMTFHEAVEHYNEGWRAQCNGERVIVEMEPFMALLQMVCDLESKVDILFNDSHKRSVGE